MRSEGPLADGTSMMVSSPPQTLLFLCTGNYYRSRFAEILFNTLAHKARLNWRAYSRGIATELGLYNPGPISAHAMAGLRSRGILNSVPRRFPLQVLHMDFRQADLVVALKEAEHRPLLEARFPVWAQRVHYWHIDDLEDAPPQQALAEIEEQVVALLQHLSAPA
jgi:protein-tyrosine phosphatase